MTISERLIWAAALLAGVTLSGCATRRIEVPPASAAIPPRPELPAGVPDALVPPPKAADGSYATINHGVDANGAVWHVRSALNVAALACRGPAEPTLIANYNALLHDQKSALAAANAAIQARFRTRFGPDWQVAHDDYMTRLYNFFAQPAPSERFCEVATQVAAQARTVSPDGFQAFAVAALPQLETPFTDLYRRYDAYRQTLAAWEADYGPSVPATAPKLEYASIKSLLAWDGEAPPTATGALTAREPADASPSPRSP